MFVYITRHGQVDVASQFPVGHMPLSDLGRNQARQLGKRLSEREFSGPIFVSPYRRCLETAQIICEQLQGPHFFPEPAISEIVKDLKWIDGFQGHTIEQIKSEYSWCSPQAELAWPWWPTSAESTDHVKARVTPFIDELLRNYDEDVLLVGHGATTKAALGYFTSDLVDHYNATLTAVQVRPHHKLLLTNCTAHLRPGQITSNRVAIG